MTHQKATLNIGDKSWDFPIHHASIGPDVLDISTLYKETGAFTFDPGFTSTASCQSDITFIDGDTGVLLYRGYAIKELAKKGDFLEVCYLLLHGELPTKDQGEIFRSTIMNHRIVDKNMSKFYSGLPPDANPMSMMCGVVGALSALYQEEIDILNEDDRMLACNHLIAKIPTLAAMTYKHSLGEDFVSPRNDLDYTSNFLYMCFSDVSKQYTVNPVLARAMDKIFILHADHEQNASTSTVRLAGSSGANPFACIASGIACLWGAAHG